jgi:glycosyltransferase involved in cell wall biosynthesis
MPLISVCLATYNGERFLAEQLQSICDQTFSDFELVVSDDGSIDRTATILETFAARDPRIRILPAQERLGFQKNFERAIAAGTGRYIAPSDQDDIWLPEKLELSLRYLRDRNVAMVYCDSAFIDGSGNRLGGTLLDSIRHFEGTDPLMFAFINCASGHAMLFDRAILAHALPFPEKPVYDWYLAAIAAAAGGVAVLKVGLVLYRQHDASVTNLILHPDARRAKGDPFAVHADELERFGAFAAGVPGRGGADYARLQRMWALRAHRFVPSLALFILRRQTVFSVRKPSSSAVRNAWRAIKMARRVKAKRRRNAP